jgi:acyl carrier protein
VYHPAEAGLFSATGDARSHARDAVKPAPIVRVGGRRPRSRFRVPNKPQIEWPGGQKGPRRPEVITLASTYERVRSIVAERLGVDEDKVTQDAEFIGDLNADSLDLVEVIMAMEQEFDLEIKDDEAENIRTVADAVRYIEEHSS